MTVIIKGSDSKKIIKEKLNRLPKRKPRRITIKKTSSSKKTTRFPAQLFTGKIKFEGDPVDIQRKIRDDWG